MSREDLNRASPEQPVRVGRYDVIGVLGQGGMGMVYEAIDVDHATPVALKTLRDLDPDTLLRFKQEFRQVADVSHPNVIALYELSCEDGLWFFTMEHVRGRDFVASMGERSAFGVDPNSELRETRAETVSLGESRELYIPGELHIREPDPLIPQAVERLRDAFSQLVSAVLSLHASGLLHLDIKPTNILVEPSGRVVLLDFGVARAIEGGLDPGQEHPNEILGRRKIVGTPAWMSPEQHRGDPLTPASDWYAVGLVLYAALTGVHAFQMIDGASLGEAKRSAIPPAPHERVEAPLDLSELALQLIDPDPTRRPTAEQMRAWVFEGSAGITAFSNRRTSKLIGRVDERSRLAQAFEGVQRGAFCVAHVRGPSGVGKSALLANLRRHAGELGALTLGGRCYERESVPYKAFDAMIDGLAHALARREADEAEEIEVPVWIAELTRIFPVLAGAPAVATRLERLPPADDAVPATEVKRRAVEALRQLLATLCEQSACVVELDDLQWADAESVQAIQRLLDPPRIPGLLLVLAYRHEEAVARPVLQSILEPADDAIVVDVGPLDEASAHVLARAAFGLRPAPDGVVERIVHNAGGVALYIEELSHLAAFALEAGDNLDVGLDVAIVRRVEALAADERALVQVLCVADNPIPIRAAVAAASSPSRGTARALWSLRRLDFIRATGSAPNDTVVLRHDGIRAAVRASLSPDRVRAIHLSLGQALADLTAREDDGRADDEWGWLFDAVRHLNVVTDALDHTWRRRAAQLDLEAGRRARRASAFALAYACFDAGARQFGSDGWDEDYGVRLALHEGAAEAAYLSARWGDVTLHVDVVKRHARSVLDQRGVWETEIDAAIARQDFVRAVDVGRHALIRLGIEIPANPSPADIIAEFDPTHERLSALTPAGVLVMSRSTDPLHMAAMRIESRITSAAYFGRPNLLPILGFRMVNASLDHGLVPATAYGLSIFGIVLNVMAMYREAHTWGGVALELMGRFEDRSLDARTSHVVHDLVCNFTVPLAGTLDDVWGVYEGGKALGDIEYAAYGAHAYIHQALYAGQTLGPLLVRAEEVSEFMRGHDQVNALHVHEPFEQLLRALTGKTADPSRLESDNFSEANCLASAQSNGSRAAQCLNRVVMGIARYTFDRTEEASALFEAARPFLDGMPSVWHTPMFHQYASLSILGLPEARRAPLMAHVGTSLETLRGLADAGPMNFAHRVSLVEAELARVADELDAALVHAGRAAEQAEAHGFSSDLGLALTLRSRYQAQRGDTAAARRELADAIEVYQAWGATARAETLREYRIAP